MHAFAQKLGTLSLSLFVLVSSGAQAAGPLFRSYLSFTGNDANPCTVQLPCRLLPAALAQTQDRGEVWMLDSANYNTGVVTISQNVTILAVPGALGSLVANNADAIDIATPNIMVTLRNLVVRNFAGSGNNGVLVTGSSVRLIVEGSEFVGLFEGIYVYADSARAVVHQSVFRNNYFGIDIEGASAGTPFNGLVDQCTVVGSSAAGIYAALANVTVSHSTMTNSAAGVHAFSGATILLEDDQITQNTTGVFIEGGTVQTTGSNNIKFNGTKVSGGSLTAVSHD